MGIFLSGRVELFTGGWVSCCWVPKRDDAGWSENSMPRRVWKTGIFLGGVVELFTREWLSWCYESPRGWRRMKWNLHAKAQRPEKRVSIWEERFSSLPEGERDVAESQREMTEDKVKLVCRCATPWIMGIFLRGRVELFTGGWMSWYWVPKRDDAENEKNDYKKDKENRKGKYEHFVWCNLMYKIFFLFSRLIKTVEFCVVIFLLKVSFLLNIWFLKKRKKKERKKERSVLFHLLGRFTL